MTKLAEKGRGTISGSFRRHLPQIKETITLLKHHGVSVRSPTPSEVTGYRNDFVRFRHDTGTPVQSENRHLQAIANSHFLYIVNPDRKIGASATMEIGYALALGIPVYTSQPPEEYILRRLTTSAATPSKLLRALHKHKPSSPQLQSLQSQVAIMARNKRFDTETLKDKTLLLTEELVKLQERCAP